MRLTASLPKVADHPHGAVARKCSENLSSEVDYVEVGHAQPDQEWTCGTNRGVTLNGDGVGGGRVKLTKVTPSTAYVADVHLGPACSGPFLATRRRCIASRHPRIAAELRARVCRRT